MSIPELQTQQRDLSGEVVNQWEEREKDLARIVEASKRGTEASLDDLLDPVPDEVILFAAHRLKVIRSQQGRE